MIIKTETVISFWMPEEFNLQQKFIESNPDWIESSISTKMISYKHANFYMSEKPDMKKNGDKKWYL